MDDRFNLVALCGVLSAAQQPEAAPSSATTPLSGPAQSRDSRAWHDAIGRAAARDGASWDGIVAIAAQHCVLTALHPPLVRLGLAQALDPELRDYLEALHALNADRNRQLRSAITRIGAALDGAGIAFAFLKGSALQFHGLYPSEGTRFQRDIDLLVAADALDAASRLLEREGFATEAHPGSHDAVEARDPTDHIVVELHRELLPGRLARLVPAERVLARRIPVPGLPQIHTPCPTDLVVHNLGHAMLHDAHFRLAELPLRDAWDFALAAQHFAGRIDWAEIEATMDRNGHHGVLAFYANAIRQCFDTAAVPAVRDDFAARLTAWRWRSRRGTPLDPRAAHRGGRNLAELPWRLLVSPTDRGRVLATAARPGRYLAAAAKIAEVGRRQPDRFT